jgi:hypothetical protein
MQENNTMTFLTAARQQIPMRQVTQPRPKAMNSRPVPWRLRRQEFLETLVSRRALPVLALLLMPAILDGKNLFAQTCGQQAAKPGQQQKVVSTSAEPRRRDAAHAASTQCPPAPETIAAPPSAAPAPILPANQPPNRARVSWDGRGLEIEAANSSLNQILHQVAAETGAKLEGLTQDQRVFGSYGPGPGSDVLLKLLDGSGYNLLMIGGRDTGTLLKIVLSARSPASRQMAANNPNRSNSEQLEPEPQPNYPPEPPSPQPVQNPFGNGEPPRDPLQFMQEILQRQQKIDEQNQQQNQQINSQH